MSPNALNIVNSLAPPQLPGNTMPQLPSTPQLGDFGTSQDNSLISQGQSALNQLNSNNGPVAGAPVTTNNTGGGLLGDLARWAPTIGSVALPAIADIATGGLATPFDIALAAAGGAGGRIAENAASGQKLFQGNDIAAGLEGGVGQGIGEGINAGLGAAGGALSKVAANASEDAGAKAVGDEALSQQADTVANYGVVKDTVQAQNNLKDNQALLDSWNKDSTDPNVMNQSAKGGLFINDIDKESLSQGNPIKTSDLISSHDIATATPEELDALAKSGIITPEGSLPDTVTPVEANSFAQNINQQLRNTQTTLNAAQKAGRASDVTTLQQQVNNLQGLYKNVQNIASTDEVNQAVAARVVTPTEKAMLVRNYGQEEADYIEQQVNSAQTHEDLVKAKLPFAQMDDVSSQAIKDQQATATTRNTSRVKNSVNGNAQGKGGLKGLFNPRNIMEGGGILEAVKGHPAIGLPLMIAGNPAAAGATGDLLTKLATGRVGQTVAPAITTALATSPNTVQGGNIVDPSQAGGIQGSSISNSPIEQLLQSDLSAAQLANKYPLLPNGGGQQAFSSLSTLIPTLMKVSAAEQAAQNLPAEFNNAGGAQGPVGGMINQLISRFVTGGPAAQYNQYAQNTGNLVSQLTGQSTPVPSITSNQSAAQQAITNINSLLQALTSMGGSNYTQATSSAQ